MYRENFFDMLVERGISVDALGACRGSKNIPDNSKNAARNAPDFHDQVVV